MYKSKQQITENEENLFSQVHNFQKLKNISLKAVNFFSNKNKSNLFKWNCLFFIFIFRSYCNFHGHVGNLFWKTYFVT